MKLVKCIALFLFAVLCCKSFAHENTTGCYSGSIMSSGQSYRIAEPEKRYIDPSQVHFDQTVIYVQLDQDWVTTSAVYTDAQGLYILPPKDAWQCGNCGGNTQSNPWTCDFCGRKRE